MIKNSKKGYKLLSNYRSLHHTLLGYNMFVEYDCGITTKRPVGWGPLSIFDDRLTALYYLLRDHWTIDKAYSHMIRHVSGRYILGICTYMPSRDSLLWKVDSEGEKAICDYFPDETKFADEITVRSIERIDPIELTRLVEKIEKGVANEDQ